MEWNLMDIPWMSFVAVLWIIPVILIVVVASFAILVPVFTLAGVVIRLYEVVCNKLGRRA